ncbi:tyrosine-type recombinase/integrase [Aliarcobacter butzleri]
MAIDINDYPNKISKIGNTNVYGLYAHKELNKFYFRFKVNGLAYKRIIDYSTKAWDKKTINKQLLKDIENYKNNPNFNKGIQPQKKEPKYKNTYTLNKVIENHFKSKIVSKENEPIKYNTSWTETKKRHYDNYIKKQIGSYTLENITPSMINECIELQISQGLKPRTVRTTLEILRPIFDEALDDKAIQSNPCNAKTVIDNKNIKRQKTKKIVNTPIETLQVFFTAIEELYKNEPFYKSLYLFGIAQRRKSEILKLRWEDIDFNSNTYLCRDTKNGETQTFYLPPSIKNELLQFREIKGWVYSSPLDNNKHISNIEKQTTKVKEKVEDIYKRMIIENGITNNEHIKLELEKKPKFTLHYFRNIGSSVLQQQGMESIISGALGHNNMNTKNLYTTIDYITSSKKYNEVIEANLILIEK